MLKNNISLFISLCFVVIFLTSCDDYSPNHLGFSKLEQIKYKGTIDVLTRQDPTTYYEGAEGLTGLEYDLVMLFAKRLNVRVNFKIPDTFDNLLKTIAADKADIAAAGLTVTAQRQQNMRFAPGYQSITEQVIYRSGRRRPRSTADLVNGILEIVKGTSHLDTLIQQQSKHPKLTWNINSELNTDSLMYLVNEGLIDFTIADSHQARSTKRFYPKLNIAFNITQPRQLAWAFPLSKDDSLYNEAKLFFQQIKKDKTLEHLLDKYYGNSGNLSYVGNCQFRKHVESRLPLYKATFEKEALKHDIDWRLLAAIGYQESHWRADVTSPTGVKGLMMLTRRTARELGIKNRTDPIQSIIGGALYFKIRLNSIHAHIQEPDRTWYALASYNVGFGHLKDAMFLTRLRKGNPNKWIDVKESLPLLTQKKWYKKTIYGYARGKEPVRYVENIRSYYDLLVWLTEEDQIEKNVMSLPKEEPEEQNPTDNQENEAVTFEPSIL